MKELEEHFRAVNEQVKIRRKLLKDFTENRNSVRYLLQKIVSIESQFISQTSHTEVKEEIEQTNINIANKRRIQKKLENEIEQYYIKINRADQLVCIKKHLQSSF